MPPAALRRPVTVTVWLVMSIACVVLSPLLLAAGALASALTRRPQPRLLTQLLISYFSRELAVLVACGTLWLGSGAGLQIRSPRFQLLHYQLLRWFIHGFTRRGLELLRIEIASELPAEASDALERDAPLLFFSRHAGPGDTFLLVDLLLSRYRRFPSVVFKETLTIDPCVDLIGHRLPHAVLDAAHPEECEARIQEIASKLRERSVLMLFPEGANFTPERRRHAIDKLLRKGRTREATVGEQMSHVLPPHPGGALAALAGNPEADVIFSAHTGLGLAAFPRQLWRHTPIGKTFQTRMWLAPADQRPHDSDSQEKWLYGWWQRIDEWVAQAGAESEPLESQTS